MSKETRTGQVIGVNGNMVGVGFSDSVMQNEVAYVRVGEEHLKSEVIRVRGKRAELQVFEDTSGIRIGNAVEFTGQLLSVELGPGLFGADLRRPAKSSAATGRAARIFLKARGLSQGIGREAKMGIYPGGKSG